MRRRMALFTLVLGVTLAALPAAPAGAHAALLESTPRDGEVLAAPPTSFELRFSESIRLSLSTFQLQRPDGTEVSLGAPTSHGALVTVPVPVRASGSFVLTWHVATADSHVATGQLLFAVGTAVVDHRASGGSLGDRSIGWLSGAARFGWFVVLALVVGMLFLAAWVRANARLEPTWVSAADARATASLRWLAVLLPLWAALRCASLIGTSVVAIGGSWRTLSSVATSAPGQRWFAILALSLVLGRALRSYAAAGRRAPAVTRALGAGVVAICWLDASAGHAASAKAPLVAMAATALHLGTATLWAGPLMAYALVSRAEGCRQHERSTRKAAQLEFFRAVSPVATWGFVLTFASGLYLAGTSIGPVRQLGETAFGGVVIGKVAALVIAVLLGLHHRRLLSAARAGRPSTERRTLGLEAAVLSLALLLAAALTGLEPAGQVLEFRAAVVQANAVVDRPQDCLKTPAFTIGCWDRYFGRSIQKQGIDVTLAEIDDLAGSNNFAKSECHQLTHYAGRSAAEVYPLGVALSTGRARGTICNSGYFHGLLEFYLQGLSDEALSKRLNSICQIPGVRRYSFDQFTCLHGIGHGLTLRGGNDIFKALPWCDSFKDPWDQQSCYGGVFMQNIIADQLEGGAVNLRADDPIYPCNAVETIQKRTCYEIVTSNILKQAGWDLRTGFTTCDRVEADFRTTCYSSMGRDISGAALLDPKKTLAGCHLATDAVGELFCIAAAARNAIGEDHDGVKATELCEAAPPQFQQPCRNTRDLMMVSIS